MELEVVYMEDGYLVADNISSAAEIYSLLFVTSW